jgi:hypothetical protein
VISVVPCLRMLRFDMTNSSSVLLAPDIGVPKQTLQSISLLTVAVTKAQGLINKALFRAQIQLPNIFSVLFPHPLLSLLRNRIPRNSSGANQGYLELLSWCDTNVSSLTANTSAYHGCARPNFTSAAVSENSVLLVAFTR